MAEESKRQEQIYYRPEIGEALQQNYQREDERWSASSQARDWAILILIGFLQFLWMFLVFLFEPGIR